MGYQGKFAKYTANVLSKVWEVDALFGVWPLGFKKSLGKINE